MKQETEWFPMETAPKDRPIVGWCVHDADPYYIDSSRLTLYGGHAEGLSNVQDGPHILEWGGSFDDSSYEYGGAWMPDWWFLSGSDFEVAANPVCWTYLTEPTEFLKQAYIRTVYNNVGYNKYITHATEAAEVIHDWFFQQ